MATMLDHQLGIKKETTYNMPVVVDRFYEWMSGSGLEWDPNIAQGAGLRVGSRAPRAARRVGLVGKGSGKLQAELLSKGFGPLLEACFGVATSTLTTGTRYQQNYTTNITGTYLPSLTIQEGIVKPGGTVDTYTYAGCTVSKFEIEMPDNGIATLTAEIDARSLATNTALATATYPAGASIYASGLPVTGAVSIGGTATAPTTTALGSLTGATTAAGKTWKLSVDSGTDTKRDIIGGRNQPTAGKLELTLSSSIEYDAVTGAILRDAQIAQTAMPILLTATTSEALSTGVATMSILLPACYINSGAIPMPGEGEVVVTEIEFASLDNLTLQPIYLSLHTADTAL